MQIKKNTICELKDGSFVEAIHGKRTHKDGGEQIRVIDLRLDFDKRAFVRDGAEDRLLYTCDIREVFNGAAILELQAVLLAEREALAEAAAETVLKK